MTFEEQLRAWGAEGYRALSAVLLIVSNGDVWLQIHPLPGPVTQILIRGNEITFTPRPED